MDLDRIPVKSVLSILLSHSDINGFISKNQYIRALTAIFSLQNSLPSENAGTRIITKDFLEYIFEKFDSDGNASVNVNSLSCGISVLWMNQMNFIKAAFILFDSDNDNRLNKEEVFTFMYSVFNVLFVVKNLENSSLTAEEMATVCTEQVFTETSFTTSALTIDENDFIRWYCGSVLERLRITMEDELVQLQPNSVVEPISSPISKKPSNYDDAIQTNGHSNDYVGLSDVDNNMNEDIDEEKENTMLSTFYVMDLNEDGQLDMEEMVAYLTSAYRCLYDTTDNMFDMKSNKTHSNSNLTQSELSAEKLARATALSCYNFLLKNEEEYVTLQEFRFWYVDQSEDKMRDAMITAIELYEESYSTYSSSATSLKSSTDPKSQQSLSEMFDEIRTMFNLSLSSLVSPAFEEVSRILSKNNAKTKKVTREEFQNYLFMMCTGKCIIPKIFDLNEKRLHHLVKAIFDVLDIHSVNSLKETILMRTFMILCQPTPPPETARAASPSPSAHPASPVGPLDHGLAHIRTTLGLDKITSVELLEHFIYSVDDDGVMTKRTFLRSLLILTIRSKLKSPQAHSPLSIASRSAAMYLCNSIYQTFVWQVNEDESSSDMISFRDVVSGLIPLCKDDLEDKAKLAFFLCDTTNTGVLNAEDLLDCFTSMIKLIVKFTERWGDLGDITAEEMALNLIPRSEVYFLADYKTSGLVIDQTGFVRWFQNDLVLQELFDMSDEEEEEEVEDDEVDKSDVNINYDDSLDDRLIGRRDRTTSRSRSISECSGLSEEMDVRDDVRDILLSVDTDNDSRRDDAGVESGNKTTSTTTSTNSVVEELRRQKSLLGLEGISVEDLMEILAECSPEGRLSLASWLTVVKCLVKLDGSRLRGDSTMTSLDRLSLVIELGTQLFDSFDATGEGVVSYVDFLAGMSVLCDSPLEDRVMVAFTLFDDDSDHIISPSELERYILAVLKVVVVLSVDAHRRVEEVGYSLKQLATHATDKCLEMLQLTREDGLGLESLSEFAEECFVVAANAMT